MSGSRHAPLSAAGASASMFLWVSRTVLSLLVFYPVLSALEASGIGSGPERDAVLFRPGALLVLELLRVGAPWLTSALKTALVLGALALVLELAPLACALDLLWAGEKPFRARVAHAIAVFPRFFWLGTCAWLSEGALILGVSLCETALRSALHDADDRARSAAPVALVALGVLALVWMNALLDLARAAVIERELSFRAAVVHALTALEAEPRAVLSGSYASAAASAFAYLTAAWLVTRIDVGAGSGVAIALAFAIHQLAVLFSIGWRVRWLERALALSAAVSSRSNGD